MHSCIYRGTISHRRRGHAANAFRYSLFMMYLDLAEIDTVFAPYWFWSSHRPALARFRRRDHYGDPDTSLDTTIRDLVERDAGQRPDGPIRLLTHLSYFGFCFNPLSVYYCYDRAEQLRHVVLEVSNTPWREQHCYVLSADTDRSDAGHRFRFDKNFHVSPFLPMDMQYRCRLTTPDDMLYVALDNYRDGEKIFGSHLSLERSEINHRSMAATLLRDPLLTARIVALIHWQAGRLWFKKAPVYTHPGNGEKQQGLAHHG